jgi:hypothetical protein
MPLFTKDQLVDHVNAYRTVSLYKELNQSTLEPVLTLGEQDAEYTYKNGDKKVLPSLKRLYLESNDPTEYNFAIGVFGSWKCWKRQCGNQVLLTYINDWRDELDIKIRASAVKMVIESASSEDSVGLNAAKYIAEKGWEKRAGRPSKVEIERQKKIHAGITADLKSDAERMGIQH